MSGGIFVISVKEILKFLDDQKWEYTWTGDNSFLIEKFCSIDNLKSNSITWSKTKEKMAGISEKEIESVLIIVPSDITILSKKANIIYTSEPKKVFFSILRQFFSTQMNSGIASDSVVLTKYIGKNVAIGHGCYIGKDVVLEDEVTIGNHVVIECPAKVGKQSIIHSGTIIGTDGFGYYRNGNKYEKVPHYGGVSIGERVEIGANTCIDRGTLEDTKIEDGVKIDNLCHIAHNVTIGKDSLIIACTLLGGSSKIEKEGYIAPGAIIRNQMKIGARSVVGMGAVVTKNIEEGKVVAGVPARVIRDNDGNL